MTLSNEAWIADGIHLVWIGPDIISLDVANDVYGLLLHGGESLSPLPERRIAADHPALLSQLLAIGIVQATPPGSRAEYRSADPPTMELRPGVDAWAPIRARILAVSHALFATAEFRRRTFSDLLAQPQRKRRVWSSHGSLGQAYAAFDAILPWIPFEGKCLQRAFMLRSHLHATGHSADWVLGVRAWPFLAHAWVQVGPIVVGDTLERIRSYTPILVV